MPVSLTGCSVKSYLVITIALLLGSCLLLVDLNISQGARRTAVYLIENKTPAHHQNGENNTATNSNSHHNPRHNSGVQYNLVSTTGSRPIRADVSNTPPPADGKPFEKFLLTNFPGSQKCVPPVGDLDLPPHVITSPAFHCGQTTTPSVPQGQRSATPRRQLVITCDAGVTKATGELRETTLSEELPLFRTDKEVKCLHRYIRERCYDDRKVPDVIHLLWYGNGTLNFRNALGLYSVVTVAKPCLVVLHGDVHPSGALWDAILPAATNFVRVYKQPQTHVHGVKIQAVQNQADIGRLQILIEYGGIYLDSDMVITRKLDIFRDVSFAANKAGSNENLANGVMFAEPGGQQLLKIWLDTWKGYNGLSWGSHSVLMLTKLAKKYPHLISHLGPIFIKFGYNDTGQFYNQTCSLQESFAVHLYRRDFPGSSDVSTIQTLNSTFGRVARFVLFGDPNLCH